MILAVVCGYSIKGRTGLEYIFLISYGPPHTHTLTHPVNGTVFGIPQTGMCSHPIICNNFAVAANLDLLQVRTSGS